MKKTKKIMPVIELKPGMVAANEIRANGIVIVNKDVALTDLMIKKLTRVYLKGFCTVYLESNEESDEEKPEALEKIDEAFVEFSLNTKQIFKNIHKLQSSGISEIREFSKQIQSGLNDTRNVIKNIVLYGSGEDPIFRHSVNVTALSAILGKWIGLDSKQINLLTYAAILHDFGKTQISQFILNKTTALTDDDFKIIKSHPTIGYDYVKQIPYLDIAVSYGVLMHHERLDGSGYPLGLKGDKIHRFAKIIAIADLFDAVNSNRAYKKRKAPFKALEIVKEDSLKKLDFEYSNIFLNHIVNYYLGENVLLNTNEVCKIIQIDVNNIERPLLLKDSDFIDLKQHSELSIEKLLV